MSDSEAGLDEDMGAGVVRIRGMNGAVREMPRAAADGAAMLRAAFEDPDAREIELPRAGGPALAYLAEYLTHMSANPRPPIKIEPLATADLSTIGYGEWEVDFADRVLSNGGQEVLYRTTLLANFVGATALLQLLSAKIASLVVDTPPEEVARVLDAAVLAGRAAKRQRAE